MRTIVRGWPARLIALVALLALAGCQSTPQATPTAAASAAGATSEPTTAPSPSTAAVDVAPLFVKAMQSLGSGALSMDGSATVGNIKVTVSGTNAFDGPDSQGKLTTTVGGVATTSETIQVAGKRYSKTGDGPWLPAPTANGNDLTKSLKNSGAGSLTDKGTTTRDGKLVHELVASSGSAFDPSAFLGSATGVSNVAGTTTFYSLEDGTPVGATIHLTWTQAAGGQTLDADMTFELAFSALGSPQSIRAPEDVWQRFSAEKRGYSIAYPANYDHVTRQGYDYFIGPSQSLYFASRTDSEGYTLNQLATEETSSAKSTFSTKAVSSEEFTVAGVRARLLSGKGTNATLGGKIVFYEAIFVKGKFAYVVAWISKVGNEAADLATFKRAMASFQLLA